MLCATAFKPYVISQIKSNVQIPAGPAVTSGATSYQYQTLKTINFKPSLAFLVFPGLQTEKNSQIL